MAHAPSRPIGCPDRAYTCPNPRQGGRVYRTISTFGGRVMRVSLAVAAVLLAFAVLAPSAMAARDRTPPSTPTGLRVVSVTEDSITIAWNASKDNSGKIHAYIAGGIYHPGNSTTKTFTGLVPNWTVTYRVQAMDPSGNTSGRQRAADRHHPARPDGPDHAHQPARDRDRDLHRLARLGPVVRPLVVRLRGADGRPPPQLRVASVHGDPVDHAAQGPARHAHVPGPRARLRRQHLGAEQHGHGHAGGERGLARRRPRPRTSPWRTSTTTAAA